MTKILPLPRLSSHKYTDEKIKYIDQFDQYIINLGVGFGIKHLGSFLLTSISGEGKFAGEYQ